MSASILIVDDEKAQRDILETILTREGYRTVISGSGHDALEELQHGEFDLVLNRHAAFNPAEVARILAPGGAFLTQQVHGMWAWDLLAAFGATPQWPDATPVKYVPRLRAAGLEIVTVKEWEGKLSFTDVGAIVYYLKAVPWEVPGFTVATHQRELFALQDRLDAGEPLAFVAKLYLIEAHKPAIS